MLSITDPVNRYAEHKEVKAFSFEDVFYYQGTSFIEEVEFLLNEEFKKFYRDFPLIQENLPQQAFPI